MLFEAGIVREQRKKMKNNSNNDNYNNNNNNYNKNNNNNKKPPKEKQLTKNPFFFLVFFFVAGRSDMEQLVRFIQINYRPQYYILIRRFRSRWWNIVKQKYYTRRWPAFVCMYIADEKVKKTSGTIESVYRKLFPGLSLGLERRNKNIIKWFYPIYWIRLSQTR